MYADHHVEFLQFSDEVSEFILFQHKDNVMNMSLHLANIMHSGQHSANLFSEFIVNQYVDVVYKIKHFNLNFKRFAFFDEIYIEKQKKNRRDKRVLQYVDVYSMHSAHLIIEY
jgi:hypothetical protein